MRRVHHFPTVPSVVDTLAALCAFLRLLAFVYFVPSAVVPAYAFTARFQPVSLAAEQRTIHMPRTLASLVLLAAVVCGVSPTAGSNLSRTRVGLMNGKWHFNEQVTHRGTQAEGLLLNVRMVNAVFEDRNKPEFDPEANTDRFIARIPDYAVHGVNAFTVCLQGGMPGYEGALNSAFEPDGALRPSYLARVERLVRACDRHGVAVILGLYYQRQSAILRDETAVRAGVVNAARWVREHGFQNVLIEIANEYPHTGFAHSLIRDPQGQAGLIRLAKETAPGLLVSASGYGDGRVHREVAEAADFLLPHWNGTTVGEIPERIATLKRFGKPIVCNEDDKTGTNAVAALRASVENGAGYGLMLKEQNQTFPFRFEGAADDPVFYAELRRLTTRRAPPQADGDARLRVIIETDAGGDPDDEQSLVRFLVYANEFDVEGIIANRPVARDRENQNPVRDGFGIVRALVNAYGRCHANLVQHDSRFPEPEQLLARTVAGYDDTEDGVRLVLRAVDDADPRPVWFCNWGTDHGSAESCLKRALDRVLRERGQDGYARFKNRLRLSSDDKFGPHTLSLAPPFPFWVDTLRPTLDQKRWYHRFSALTSRAGGFDVERDVRTSHGPLGALYPSNTGLPQKEGDTMMFLYLVPTGMNDPNEPTWGSWAGRYGPNEECPGKPYFWANQTDTWRGATNRDNTLARWATDLQNDFRARLDWCVKSRDAANHQPVVALNGYTGRAILRTTAEPGEVVNLSADGSTDPDGNALSCEWFVYPEAGTYRGDVSLSRTAGRATSFVAPKVDRAETIHVLLQIRDDGQPPLCGYRRAVISVEPP
jgi:hypothetical protein